MKEAIQRDCTRYAPGIEIIGVRVTKPKIPASIARNYEIMEEERTKVQRTLKRELKVLEIVKREGDSTSGALGFIIIVACNFDFEA
jgi:hypothetical protein